MKTAPAMRGKLDLIVLITSFCFASSPASIVQAFGLPTTARRRTTTTALILRRPHRINGPEELLRRSHMDPIISEKADKMKISLKATTSDENASSSVSSSPSFLDVVVAKIGSTTSIVVAGIFFVVLCHKRDALMVAFFFGAISNAIFGKVLKKILKIERPEVALAENDQKANNEVFVVPKIDQPCDNGMPSSHAMSLGFICTFVALWLPITTIPLMAYAAISLIYRVRVNLHTVDQIAVGAILGTFDGAVWWNFCTNGLGGFNVVELVSSSGMINEFGQLHWYFLSLPLLVGAAVVGSVERRLGKYFRSGDSDDVTDIHKQN